MTLNTRPDLPCDIGRFFFAYRRRSTLDSDREERLKSHGHPCCIPHFGGCHISRPDQIQCHARQHIDAVLNFHHGISIAFPWQPTQREP